MKKTALTMGFLMIPIAAWAHPQGEQQRGGAPFFDDQAIESRKKELDERQGRLSREIESEFSEMVEFQTKRKDERLGFEKEMADREKSFLDSLKGKPAAERERAWRDFKREQRGLREEFRKGQYEKRRAKRHENRREHAEFREKVRVERRKMMRRHGDSGGDGEMEKEIREVEKEIEEKGDDD